MSAYLGSMKVWDSSGSPAPAEWVRPADWLQMPEISPSEQKIVGLHAVHADGNFCAFTIAGAFTVDWGDGVVENFASGATAYHEHSYTDADLDGTESELGYKQALVTITPQSGQNLTNVNFQVKHNKPGLVTGYATGWLDISMSVPNCTAFTLGGSTVKHGLLQRFKFIACGLITSLANTFSGCASLASVDLAPLAGAPITSLVNAFSNCASLPRVDLSALAGAQVTTLSNAFYGCRSLATIDLSPFDGAPINNITYTFQGCSSLVDIDLTPLAGAPITSLSSTFYNCHALASIDLTPLAGALINNLSFTFFGCSSLSSLDLAPLAGAPVTTMTYMLQDCYALAYVDLSPLAGAPITSLSNIFSGCSSLAEADLTPFNGAPITAISNAFYACISLSSLKMPSPITFSVASCKLSAAALDALYTSLPTVTGKTLTVTGNYGTTGHTPSIATAKGWTITV